MLGKHNISPIYHQRQHNMDRIFWLDCYIFLLPFNILKGPFHHFPGFKRIRVLIFIVLSIQSIYGYRASKYKTVCKSFFVMWQTHMSLDPQIFPFRWIKTFMWIVSDNNAHQPRVVTLRIYRCVCIRGLLMSALLYLVFYPHTSSDRQGVYFVLMNVRMAKGSKALRSGRRYLCRWGDQTPLLTSRLPFMMFTGSFNGWQ